ASALPTGANQVVAEIKDLATNLVSASRTFNVDTVSPTITIAQPTDGSRIGVAQVDVVVRYSDDQALDLTTFSATLDGAPVSLAQDATGAPGRLGPLPDGTHTLEAHIRDRAGHESVARSHFTVDTSGPTLRIVQPASGALLATATPEVDVAYSDPGGV